MKIIRTMLGICLCIASILSLMVYPAGNQAEQNQVSCFGSQVKFNDSASYNIRFVATVDVSALQYQCLGFDVVWSWTEKNGATGRRESSLETATVYTSVYGKGDYGEKSYTKEDLDNGHTYFLAIPFSQKIYIDRYELSTFEITPYAVREDGEKMRFATSTVTYHDGAVSDGTIVPKTEQLTSSFMRAEATVPELHEIVKYNPTISMYQGIKACWFDGMDRNGKKTKVFCYVGYPEGASAEQPVPAVVLLHGGGGHAYLPWVKMWNDRGYAAIAIDHTGYFPTTANAGYEEVCNRWKQGIPEFLAESAYVNAPDKDNMGSAALNLEDMWMYHAVGQAILAGNILRADSRVVADEVGICGISWGGVVTSIAIGYESRFAFAIPIYGSGYLDESMGWMKEHFASAAVRALWLAQDRFENVSIPVLWLCWNDDSPFSINSNTKSYLDTVARNSDTRIAMIDHMYHSHTDAWKRPESYAFADSVVKGDVSLTGFVSQPVGRELHAELSIPEGITEISAKLYYHNRSYVRFFGN